MTQPAKKYYTPEEYLALEEAASLKSEYYRGEIFQMSGGSHNHNTIALNIASELNVAFRQQSYIVYNSDMRVLIEAEGLYTYPDVAAVCGPVQFAEGRDDTIINPTLIVEVLSPSTRNYDRQGKFDLYRAIPALQEYVLVDQERVQVEYFRKLGPAHWELLVFNSPAAILSLQSVNVAIPLEVIYSKTIFDE